MLTSLFLPVSHNLFVPIQCLYLLFSPYYTDKPWFIQAVHITESTSWNDNPVKILFIYLFSRSDFMLSLIMCSTELGKSQFPTSHLAKAIDQHLNSDGRPPTCVGIQPIIQHHLVLTFLFFLVYHLMSIEQWNDFEIGDIPANISWWCQCRHEVWALHGFVVWPIWICKFWS